MAPVSNKKINSKVKRREAKKGSDKVETPTFEYQWPPSSGNYYALQSLLSRFLNEPTFHQRHLSLNRRRINVKERQYLREIGLLDNKPVAKIVAIQCNFKLMEVMKNDYPDRYKEYAKWSKIAGPMSSPRPVVDKPRRQSSTASNLSHLSKQQILFREAVYHAAEFNSQLAKERREERSCYFDIQTHRVHVPANTTLRLHPNYTKKGGFPVAILSGQYSDTYYRYSSQQLNTMPVKTVLKLPVNQTNETDNDQASAQSNLDEQQQSQPHSSSDVAQSSDSDRVRSRLQQLNSKINTTPSNTNNTANRHSNQTSATTSATTTSTTNTNNNSNNTKGKLTDTANDTSSKTCSVCFGGEFVNDLGDVESLIKCSQCGSLTHPTCLELTPDMVKVIKTYNWQCMDCKTCTSCSDPYDEDKMMFCDRCDRGYHTFCVGLDNIPSGNWICPSCTPYVNGKNSNSHASTHSKKK